MEPHPVRVLSEPGPKPDGAADEVKHVMSGREGEVEHFVAKESHHTDHHQNCSAQQDIDLCQRASHFSLATLPFARDSDSIGEFRGAYGSGQQAVKSTPGGTGKPANYTRSVKQIDQARIGEEPGCLVTRKWIGFKAIICANRESICREQAWSL